MLVELCNLPIGLLRVLARHRGYSAFNAAQVDNCKLRVENHTPMLERIAAADSFFAGLNADLRHGGNRAFYSPAGDFVQMPPFDAFLDKVSYYSTLAHDHTHWTATVDRCDKQLGKRYGDKRLGRRGVDSRAGLD